MAPAKYDFKALTNLLKVESFQPVYKFNERHREDLRLGNEVIKETLDRETAKLDREKHAKEREQQAREEAARNVPITYLTWFIRDY